MVNTMKAKIVTFIVAALTATAMFSPVSAAQNGKSYGSVGKVLKTTITVDGKKDEAYSKGLNLKTEINNEGISADAWLLWSDGYLYVYADVTDATRDTISADEKASAPWNADSFEIFVDSDNDGQDYAMQYRVDSEGYGTWKDRNSGENFYTPDVIGDDFLFAAIDSNRGTYSIEMRVPMEAAEGANVGINFQINGVQGKSFLVEDGWNTPEYGYITLGGSVMEETAETPIMSDDASSAETADHTSLLILTAATLTGALIVRKRKKS